jgi:hypothetical protein
MTGIIVVAYQPGLEGWPRFVSLAVGSIFLFALTLEAVKKRLLMDIISDRLKKLQGAQGLKLADFEFSTDPSDVEDSWRKIVEEAIEKWHKKELEKETWLQPGADSKRRK